MNRKKMIEEIRELMLDTRSYTFGASATIAVDYMLEKFSTLLEAVDDLLTVINPGEVWPGEIDTLRDRYNELKHLEG